MPIETITPRKLAEIRNERPNAPLIDVRTEVEFQRVHAQGATNIPLHDLDPDKAAESLGLAKDQPIYTICKTGSRSSQAAKQFDAAGFGQVYSVDGGTEAWDKAGLAVERGESNVISLERQVRIAAGSLVVIGVVLGYFVHPALLLISAFVGCGLVFAGVTDRCGMAVLLGRMPWNRVKRATLASDDAVTASSH